jgi:vacuolar-type H+-ATPase subunit E/Vma4
MAEILNNSIKEIEKNQMEEGIIPSEEIEQIKLSTQKINEKIRQKEESEIQSELRKKRLKRIKYLEERVNRPPRER